MRPIADEVRYSFRALRKQPGATAAAVIVLALAIGANVVIFSLIDVLLPAIRKILDCLGLPSRAPPIASASG